MAHGFGGSYWGRVVGDQDPLGEQRLQVVVPEIFGDAGPAWARASREPGDDRALPAIGDDIWIWFEAGDTDYPVWHRPEETGVDEPPADQHRAYLGVFRGRVVSNLDPLEERRLEVVVPEIALDPMWARPSGSMADASIPEIDTEVWIEFESGDAAYPVWVGIA
jgi:hypothetical protein